MARRVPFTAVRVGGAVAATADQLATQAALWAVGRGGNAVDAAIAANAALAVTAPHQCGMGGDLFAIVHTPAGEVTALNASGRAGSGVDAVALRAAGADTMPLRHDIRTVTAPGCVDGWQALHDRYGSIPLDDLLSPAIAVAARGFPASPLLVAALAGLDEAARQSFTELVIQATTPGAIVRRPGVALTLQAIARGGRDAFYGGVFGEGLAGLPGSPFTEGDLLASHADWVDPVHHEAFGVDLVTVGPNSQGYLTLAIAALAEAVGLPDDADDPAWAHVLVEAAKVASFDRPDVLHEGADGRALLDAAVGRAGAIDRSRASAVTAPGTDGDTTYLCTADADGWAVSLIQSNAGGLGSWLVEPASGINLHNRGIGFSLVPGHPAELGPGRRPPHTLSPALAMREGQLAAVFGTMGGDAQPQILAQLAARLFRQGADVAEAVAAPRWVLRAVSGFDTWTSGSSPTLVVEEEAPGAWAPRLRELGHPVATAAAFDGGFGHAHAITVEQHGGFAAAADPRARVGSAAGV
jgi:gamma-glutamyltranspeptidase/glutathione hydrolase